MGRWMVPVARQSGFVQATYSVASGVGSPNSALPRGARGRRQPACGDEHGDSDEQPQADADQRSTPEERGVFAEVGSPIGGMPPASRRSSGGACGAGFASEGRRSGSMSGAPDWPIRVLAAGPSTRTRGASRRVGSRIFFLLTSPRARLQCAVPVRRGRV